MNFSRNIGTLFHSTLQLGIDILGEHLPGLDDLEFLGRCPREHSPSSFVVSNRLNHLQRLSIAAQAIGLHTMSPTAFLPPTVQHLDLWLYYFTPERLSRVLYHICNFSWHCGMRVLALPTHGWWWPDINSIKFRIPKGEVQRSLGGRRRFIHAINTAIEYAFAQPGDRDGTSILKPFPYFIHRTGILLDLSEIESGTNLRFNHPLKDDENPAIFQPACPRQDSWPLL